MCVRALHRYICSILYAPGGWKDKFYCGSGYEKYVPCQWNFQVKLSLGECFRMFNFLNAPSTRKMPLLLPGMKTWSLPYSNLLPVQPTRGIRWPPSWPNQSCCPSLKHTAQIHTDPHCVPTAWYETEPCTNLLQLRRVTTMTQYTVLWVRH